MRVRKEVKIGIASLAILAITYWGINFLKGQNLFIGTNIYYTTYSNVEGLEMSAPVIIKGMKVGTVLNVGLNDVNGDIKVTFSAGSKYRLPVDSRAVLAAPSMLSGKAIVIEPGTSSEIIKDRGTLSSSKNDGIGSLVNDISGKAVALIDTLTTTLNRVNTLMSNKMIGDLHSTVGNLKDLSGNANDIIESEKAKIAKLTTSLNELSEELKNTMPKLNGTISNFQTLSDSLNQSLPDMINEINGIISDLNNGEGSIGKLLKDNRLYDNLTLTAEEAAALLADLKANPKKYVHFSLFGKKDKNKEADKK